VQDQEFEVSYRQIDKKMGQCLLCYKIFKISGMPMHIKSHQSCSKCGKHFNGRFSSKSLKRHQIPCNKKGVIECEFCKKVFEFKSRKKYHEKKCVLKK
jgi:hypothetical protein